MGKTSTTCRLPYEANFGNQNTELKFGEDGDIRKLSGLGDAGLRSVDVLHAGFPCQSFSVAGRREGFNDSAGNGRLMFEIFRLIEEWSAKAKYRPRVIVFENTPNFIIGNGGEWFRKFCMELTRIGYWFSLRMLSKLTRRLTLAWFKIESALYDCADRSAYNGNRFDFTTGIEKQKRRYRTS